MFKKKALTVNSILNDFVVKIGLLGECVEVNNAKVLENNSIINNLKGVNSDLGVDTKRAQGAITQLQAIVGE